MKALKVVSIVLAVLVIAGLGFVYGGIFNVAADDPHWGLTQRLLEVVRERSVAMRAIGLAVPPLDDPNLIAMGAEHYSEMCTGCHLAPGQEDTELRAGLHPKPPNLAEHGLHGSPEQTFWIVKHGFKSTPQQREEAEGHGHGEDGHDHQHGEADTKDQEHSHGP